MIVGYARTSTVDQIAGFEAQSKELSTAGCEKIFREQVSSVTVRLQLQSALDFVRDGDVFVVTKLDRLARSVGDLMAILQALERKHVAVRILNLGMDTQTPTGKLMLTVLGGVAQYAEPAVMRSDPIEVEVWPARWPLGAPHNIQRYGSQRFRDCGEVRSKDWTVWREPGAQPVRAGLDLSWLKGPGLCVARQTDITFETVKEPCDVLHRI